MSYTRVQSFFILFLMEMSEMIHNFYKMYIDIWTCRKNMDISRNNTNKNLFIWDFYITFFLNLKFVNLDCNLWSNDTLYNQEITISHCQLIFLLKNVLRF